MRQIPGQRSVSCVTLLAVLSLAGCAAAPRPGLLPDAQRAYDSGDFGRTQHLSSEYLAADKTSGSASQAYYLRGLANARLNRRPQAYDDLQLAVRTGGNAEVAWRANVQLGVLHFEDQHFHDAVNAFEAAAKAMPPRPPLDYVLYRYGQSLERIGRWAEARVQFQRVLREFPAGSIAGNARRRLDLNATHFAIQCGAYGQKQNAANAAAELGRAGLPAGMYREARAGGDVWVVRIGQYRTYAEAQQALARVRAEVPDAVIWP